MTLDTALAGARDRLLTRATREGLATLGYETLDSPLGPLWVVVGRRGLVAIQYGLEADQSELRRLVRAYGPGLIPDGRRVAEVARQLDQYFRGERRAFDLDVDTARLTPFQQRVLKAATRVPFGKLATYATVARQAGNRAASRAAGGALGANPIPIVIPCHRIVASDGSLGGYSGGLENKRKLLALEGSAVLPGGGGLPPARDRSRPRTSGHAPSSRTSLR